MDRSHCHQYLGPALVGVILAWSAAAVGQDALRVTAQLSNPGVTNYTGYVFDLDAANPEPARSRAVLRAGTTLSVSFPIFPIGSATYGLALRLITSAGDPVPLLVGEGLGDVLTTNITVARPVGGRFVTLPIVASLRPAARLDESLLYRVSATLSEDLGAGPVLLTNVVEAAGRQYFHFTNVTSPDAALNVLAALDSVALGVTNGNPVCTVRFAASRWDDFNETPGNAEVRFGIGLSLVDQSSGLEVSLATNRFVMTRTMTSYKGTFLPDTLFVEAAIPLAAAGTPLAYSHQYIARVALEHLEPDETAVPHGTRDSAPAYIMPLSGKLYFGAFETRFTRITNDPRAGAIPNPDFPNDGLMSTLAVANQSGFIPARTNLTYGDGTPLPVHIFDNGDALFLGNGKIILTGSINGRHAISNARFGYARLELSNDGLNAFDAYAGFPAGAGFAIDGTTRTLLSRMPLGRVKLTASLLPEAGEFALRASDLGLSRLWFHHERLPLRLATDRIAWKVSEGAFEMDAGSWAFLREPELAFLEGPSPASVLDPETVRRAANDHFFRFARDTEGTVLRLRVDPDGRGGLDATVAMGGGDFETHYPIGVTVPVQQGRFEITNNAVDLASSLIAVDPTRVGSVTYNQGCPDPGCASSATGTVDFTVPAGLLNVTPDGGLVGVVEVRDLAVAPMSLDWGALGGDRYAQSVQEFSAGELHVAGFTLRNDETSAHLAEADQPGALLNTGYGAEGAAEPPLERPFTEGYAAGLANYPGFNFRLAQDGGATAVSYIAGQRVPSAGTYPVKANSKYYFRRAGVSGRHQAVTGQFPRDLLLYGFKTSLDGFRLSYLDNIVQRSATDGGIEVPFPSDFVQEFAELRLRCNGQLLDALIKGESRHRLAYWLAPFRALTLEFRGALEAPCDTTEGKLLLGSSVTLPLLNRPALGVLGFSPDGNLVSASDNISGVDSRLSLPATLEIAGTEGKPYRFASATKAYFNRWPGAGGDPADGFVAFAGTLDIPWFLDSKVQAHAIGGGPNPLLFLIGGWNSNGKPDDPGRAWLDGQKHSYFDRQDFDPNNRGYPDGVALATYRDSGSQQYRIRGQQRLFGLSKAAVDLPIVWQPGSRSFRSGGQQQANVLVFDLQGEAERLTSRHAHLNFAATVSQQVPHFSASEFLLGEIEGRTGLFSAVSNAIVRSLNNNALARTLRDGADELDRVLSPDLGKLFGDDLLSVLNEPVDDFLDEVLDRANAGAVNGADFHEAVCQQLASGNNALRNFQQQFVETSELVDTVGGRILSALNDAQDAVSSAITIVELKEVAPLQFRRTVVAEIVKRAAREAPADAPPLVRALAEKVAPDILDGLVDEYLGDALEPSLAQVENTLRQVDDALNGLIRDLGLGQGVLRAGIDKAQQQLTGANSFYGDITNAVCGNVAAITVPVTQALQDRVRIRENIKRLILAELLKGVFAKETHLVLKQFLLANRGIFRGALEELFAHVNDTLVGIALGPARDLVKDELAALDTGVIKALEKLQDILQGTRLYGYADITDDDLRKLRVDGEFRFALGPADMGEDARLALDAFYQIEHFHGDSPGRGCRPAGGSFLEVNFGASTTPPGGFAQGLKLGLTGRYSLDNQGRLLGVAGGITASGAKRMGGFAVKDPQVGFSFGEEGSYLGGSAAGSFKGFTLQARLFAGVACRLGELELIDGNTAAVLAANGVGAMDKVAGFYVAGDITVPLEKLLPIPLPRTCLLHVEGRGGTGYFGFLSPTAGPAFLVGIRQRLGIEGEFLCFLRGEGDLDLVGAVGIDTLGTPQATVAGTLKVSAEVGICPVCDDISRTFPWVARLRADDVNFDPPF